MSGSTGSGASVYRFPHERAGETVPDAAESLLAALASEDDEEQTEAPDRQTQDEPEVQPATDEGQDTESETEGEETAEEEVEDPAAEDAEEEPSYEVSLPGGEKERVPLSELLAGYSRTADYTRKTQQLADERRQAQDAIAAETAQARTYYASRLQALEVALNQLTPAEPDWDKLRVENPVAFAAAYADHQRHKEQLAQIQTEAKRVADEQALFERQQLQAVVQVEQQRLLQAIPEWSDSTRANAEKTKLVAYAKSYGYTDADLDGIYDHRILVMLRKAQLFDEMQTRGKQEVKAKVAKAAPVLQPGGRAPSAVPAAAKAKVKDHQRAMKSLVRTGRVRDAARVLEGLLPDE